MTSARRGFTLIEMLIVTVLGSLVLIAALQVLITNQRTFGAQNAVISGQQGLRAASDILFSELRLVSASGGDILQMSQDSMRVRVMRKFSRTCDVTGLTGGSPSMRILNPGPVNFLVNDSVYIYADNDERDDDDDTWIKARVTAIAAITGTPVAPCNNGFVVTFNGYGAAFTADSVRLGAPIRSFEIVRYGLTSLYGDWYLGRAVGGAPLRPVAGPLRQTSGLAFAFRDSLNATTATPANVRQIGLTLRTSSTMLNSLNQPISDSLATWIYTRN